MYICWWLIAVARAQALDPALAGAVAEVAAATVDLTEAPQGVYVVFAAAPENLLAPAAAAAVVPTFAAVAPAFVSSAVYTAAPAAHQAPSPPATVPVSVLPSVLPGHAGKYRCRL